MAYTSGATASSDIIWPLQASVATASSTLLVCGWWRPTTLTAARSYFSFGNVVTARIGTTTSEIEMITDQATTDGVFTTTGAGIVVDEWHFLAFLGNFGSGNSEWRLWKTASVNEVPFLVTTTNTTPGSGALSGSGSFYLGNAGTSATNAFQGQIGSCSMYVASAAQVPNPFGITAYAPPIATADEEVVFREFVMPAFLGAPFPVKGIHTAFPSWQMVHIDMEGTAARAHTWGNSSASPAAPAGTNNGLTFSSERPPIVVNSPSSKAAYPGFFRR